MDELDNLIKEALDTAFDEEELVVDEELIASTLESIKASEADRETIRAEYEQEMPAKPVRKKNIIAIISTSVAVAAVAVGALVIGLNSGFTKSDSSVMTTASKDSAVAITESYAEEAASTAVADKYYFDDESDYMSAPAEPSILFADVYSVDDPEIYAKIMDEIMEISSTPSQMTELTGSSVEEAVEASDSDDTSLLENITTDPAPEAGAVDVEAIEGATASVNPVDALPDKEDEGEVTMKDLLTALRESNEKIRENGGLPGEDATMIVESEATDGDEDDSDVIDYDYSPDKNPYWEQPEDASDNSFIDKTPLITVYDSNDETGLNVGVMIYDDRAVVEDYRSDVISVYEVEDGESLAKDVLEIVSDN